MGVYSKSYQTVTAGRVREDEAIAYFGKNEVSTPVGNFSTNRTGGAVAQPKITKDQANELVGKQRSTTASKNYIATAYDAGSNNSAKS
jgi:hypothetical protein